MKKETEKKYEIIMFGRGFVIIVDANKIEHSEEFGHHWIIVPRYTIIRYWGTDYGIGEIVHNGPTDQTKCDPQFWTAKIPVEAIHQRIAVTRSEAIKKWEKMINETDQVLLSK